MSFSTVGPAGTGRARSTGPNPVVRRPDPARAFEGLAEGIQDVKEEMEAQQQRRDRVEAAEQQAKFQRKVEERVNELDPTAPDYQQQVQEEITATRAEAQSDAQITDPQVQTQLEASLARQEQGVLAEAVVQQDEAITNKAKQTVNDVNEAAITNIADDPQTLAAQRAKVESTIEQFDDVLSDDQKQALRENMNSATAQAAVQGLARQGDIEAAQSIADQFAQEGQINNDTRQTLKAFARQEEQRQQNEFLERTARERQDLDVQISTIQNSEDLAAARDAFETAQDQGLFQGAQGQRASLEKKLIRARQGIRDEQRESENLLRKQISGRGMDTQTEANKLWSIVQRDENAPDRLQSLTGFARHTGFIPEAGKQTIENAERRADMNTLPRAIGLHSAVKEANPNVDTGAASSGSRVRLGRELMNSMGLSSNEAASLVATNSPDRQTIEARKGEFDNELASDVNGNEMVREAVGGDAGPIPFVGEDATVSPELQRRFENMVRSNFALTGNMKAARNMATERARELFGVTRVEGGDPRVVEMPVEKSIVATRGAAAKEMFSAAPETMAEGVRSDVLNEMGRAGIEPGEPPESMGPMPGFRLKATEKTRRQLSNGDPPEYELRVLNDAGTYEQVRDGGTGLPITYTVPTVSDLKNTAPVNKLIDRETGEVREERKERQERIESDAPDAAREGRGRQSGGDREGAGSILPDIIESIPAPEGGGSNRFRGAPGTEGQ